MKKIYRQYTDDQLMLSDNYGKHVSAMTGEALHSKSDIAAELAIRDDENAELKAQVEQLQSRDKSESLQWYQRGFESCIEQILDMGILSENGSIIKQLRQRAKGGE